MSGNIVNPSSKLGIVFTTVIYFKYTLYSFCMDRH